MQQTRFGPIPNRAVEPPPSPPVVSHTVIPNHRHPDLCYPPPPRLSTFAHSSTVPSNSIGCLSFDGLLDSPLLFPAEQAQLAEALTDAETQLRRDNEREQELRDKEEEVRGYNTEVLYIV